MSKRKSQKASPNQIINDSRKNNNISKTEINKNVNKNNNILNRIKEFDYGDFFQTHKKPLYIAMSVLIISVGAYVVYYSNMPALKATHNKEIKGVLASYDGELHPFEILSSTRAGLAEVKGDPSSKGDGKTNETKFVVYKFEWFGKVRETILYYDKQQRFTKIKLKIGDEKAKDLSDKLTSMFGNPLEDKDPTVKGGSAIWIKDTVQYKLIHHGGYATIEMKIARYRNTANLEIGKNPLVIQKVYKQDLNKDGKQESIMLVGNKYNPYSTNYNHVHLVIWDGKTYVKNIPAETDGGSYPQMDIMDINEDGKDEVIVSSDNNDVVKNYNVFSFDGKKIDLIYNGYDEPDIKTKEQQ